MPILKFGDGPYDGQSEYCDHQPLGIYWPTFLDRAVYQDGRPLRYGTAFYYRTDIVTIRGETLYLWEHNNPPDVGHSPAMDVETFTFLADPP